MMLQVIQEFRRLGGHTVRGNNDDAALASWEVGSRNWNSAVMLMACYRNPLCSMGAKHSTNFQSSKMFPAELYACHLQ